MSSSLAFRVADYIPESSQDNLAVFAPSSVLAAIVKIAAREEWPEKGKLADTNNTLLDDWRLRDCSRAEVRNMFQSVSQRDVVGV